MATRPLQVYLDSSDYSVLSDPRRPRSAAEREVLDYLHAAQRRGAIQIRYSIIHIVEACHRDTMSKPMALARAALIDELSGDNVLRAPPEIIRDECTGTAVGKRPPELALDDQGRWYPSVGDLGAEMRADMSSLPRDAAAIAGDNRAARRAAKKAFGTPAKQYAFIRELCKDVEGLAAFCAKHGIPDRIAHEGVFRRIFDHRQSNEQVSEMLCHEMFHPQHFIEDHVDRFEGARAIRGSVRKLGDRLIESVAMLRNALDRARQLADPAIALDLTGTRRMTRAQMDGFREKLIGAAMGEKQDGIPLQEMVISTSRSCAGIDLLVMFAESWLADLIGGANAAGRNPKISDAGDALHAFYLPYVDVWRGDRYACDGVRNKASEYGVSVAPSLRVLPESVEALIESRVKTTGPG